MVCIILCAAASVIKYWAYTLLTLYKDRSAPMSYSYNSTGNFFVTMYQDLDWLISFLSVLISGEIIALILWKTFERSLGMIIWSNLKCHFKKNLFLKVSVFCLNFNATATCILLLWPNLKMLPESMLWFVSSVASIVMFVRYWLPLQMFSNDKERKS